MRQNSGGFSTLLMVMVLGTSVLTGMLLLANLQVTSARQGKVLRERRLRQTNSSSISQYLQLALRSRWCVNPDLTRDIACSTKKSNSLEQLILTNSNWQKLVGATPAFPGVYAALSGSIPESCDSGNDLLSGTEGHPLRGVLEELGGDYRCVQWKLRRGCSAAGGGDSTTCPAADRLPPPLGIEEYYSLELALVPKDQKTGDLGAGNTTGEQVFAILPRTLTSYAAVFKGDLSASYPFSGGVQASGKATDSILRFPSGQAGQAMVSFHGPVLTNGDLVLPDPQATGEPYVRVQFNDAVILESGKVVSYCNAGSSCDTRTHKAPYPAGKATEPLSSSSQFGGLKGGVTQDSTKDAGLDCLLADTYFPSGGSYLPGSYPKTCVQGDPSRISAVLAALDLKATKTSKSTLVIRQCGTTSADQKLGCSATAPPAPTPQAHEQSFLLGLSDRNYFLPQIEMGGMTPVVTTPGEGYFDANPSDPRRPRLNPPAFPPPHGLSSTFSTTASWASFTLSEHEGGQPDPRKDETRNKPVFRVHLVREDSAQANAKSVIARTELGVSDQISFDLKLDLAHEPSARTQWVSTFCGDDNAPSGNCYVPGFYSGGSDTRPVHPLKKLVMYQPCHKDQLDATLEHDSLGMRLRQQGCELSALHQLWTHAETGKDSVEASFQQFSDTVGPATVALNAYNWCCGLTGNDCPSGFGNHSSIFSIKDTQREKLEDLKPDCLTQREELKKDLDALETAGNKFIAAVEASQIGDGTPAEIQLKTIFSDADLDPEAGKVMLTLHRYLGFGSRVVSARTFLRNQFSSLYTLFKRTGQATGGYDFDSTTNVAAVLGTASAISYTLTPQLPSLSIQTFPVPNQHPLLPNQGLADERSQGARYYWRSDLLRVKTSVQNADLFPDDLRKFQIEFEVFDSQSDKNGNVRLMDPGNFGPNCSRFSNTSITYVIPGSSPPETVTINDPAAHCGYGILTDGDAELLDSSNNPLHRYFRKSPNLIRYERVSSFETGTTFTLSANGILPGGLLARPSIDSDVTHKKTGSLLQSCTAPAPTPTAVGLSAARFNPNTNWQVMRCPADGTGSSIPTFSGTPPAYFPDSAHVHRAGAQWKVITDTSSLLGSATFPGELPEVDASSFDPIELLFYDFFKVGGTDVLSNQDSFAAATARTSWNFRRPKRYNYQVLETEDADHLVIGSSDVEASAWISTNGKFTTQYDDSGVKQPTRQLWFPESSQKVQIYSILNTCLILPSVTTLVGMMGCDRLEILPRSQPLDLIGTFLIGQIDLPSSLSADINFYNLDHPIALARLRAGGYLKTSDQEACPAIYGNDSIPSVFQLSTLQKEKYRSCEVGAIRGRAIPFTWTAIDPECGFDQNSVWRCQTPNWYKRFRLLQVSGKGAL